MTDAPPRILYIDDDEALGRLTQKTLGRMGFAVSLAAGSDEAVAILRGETFDAVALDHHMPGRDGLATLALIAELPAPPPVVYATGTDEGRVAVAALKAGAADYVIKDVGGSYFELLAGALRGAIEAADVRRAKEAAEAEMRAARDRAEMLLKEVNHRVANSLAIVTALTHMQAQGLTDPAAREALAEMQRRIAAIAQVHRQLYGSGNGEAVELAVYLDKLAAELNETLGAERIKLHSEPVTISTDKAVSIGVIVTELVSNACKYAYPPGDHGPVRIALDRQESGNLRLIVEDDGVGWSGDGPIKGTGVGSRVMKAMATSLRGTLRYESRPRGTRAVLQFAA
jgi:two-component sensor histidine kinase